MDSSFITLWIQGTPHWFKVYYLETNSLVSVHQREYCVYFFQASATSKIQLSVVVLGIRFCPTQSYIVLSFILYTLVFVSLSCYFSLLKSIPHGTQKDHCWYPIFYFNIWLYLVSWFGLSKGVWELFSSPAACWVTYTSI